MYTANSVGDCLYLSIYQLSETWITRNLGSVVRRPDSAVHWIAIFSTFVKLVVSFAAVLSVGHISLPTNGCLPQQYILFQLCEPIMALVPKSETRAGHTKFHYNIVFSSKCQPKAYFLPTKKD